MVPEERKKAFCRVDVLTWLELELFFEIQFQVKELNWSVRVRGVQLGLLHFAQTGWLPLRC